MADKNERDNANYASGYEAGRNGGASKVADYLFRGFYGKEWNDGFDQGEKDHYKYDK